MPWLLAAAKMSPCGGTKPRLSVDHTSIPQSKNLVSCLSRVIKLASLHSACSPHLTQHWQKSHLIEDVLALA